METLKRRFALNAAMWNYICHVWTEFSSITDKDANRTGCSSIGNTKEETARFLYHQAEAVPEPGRPSFFAPAASAAAGKPPKIFTKKIRHASAFM
ncbi:hypothetical protein AALC17_00155 [Oscillospiraceae bacterium 38-13]